ncbi:MAG TPA: quinoprotein dehydrogenase-associated putative ABC transporter substrate-binding protein [Thermoanaerobaculia bacterium]|jgi:mxaJ protein|nr:quinoprotein dehydrogenase-associated putative ABC transporter substrate-binding protein [Thermoanaerobaculia bacterium]
MKRALIIILLLAGCARAPRQPERVLRVCADPNNLPFSNQRQQGFENRIASLIARDFGARVEYTWLVQRPGFIRNTLRAGRCDMVMGIPSNYELALPTAPYYRSSFVFVSRRDRHLGITSLDDQKLRALKIGVQLVGDEGSPAIYALSNRGLARNLEGYLVASDYSQPEPARNIVDAVTRGEVDLAVVWGPQAGFFAKGQQLEVVPVTPQIDPPFLPFVFDISMGVRREDKALRDRLDQELERRRPDIERILDQYGVPRV